jgi:hypothetical protein
MDKRRRQFIRQTSLATAASFLLPALELIAANPQTKHKILLRSGWQTINIGDIGHTFGALELFKQYLPDVQIVLWANLLDRGVYELLMKSYPGIQIIEEKNGAGKETKEQLKIAFQECSMFFHNSGPYVTTPDGLRSWWKETGKPFGVYGVSLDTMNAELQETINHASFFYCRDTESLKYLRSLKLKCPVQDFAPDATFAINVHDQNKADTFLNAHGLKKGEFICVIPRLRYTPNWKLKNRTRTEEDKWKDEVSALFKERDAVKLREIITRWVTETGLKVLACPEVTYQVELAKETLVDPLPEEIKKNVIWRDSFWLPDEAASVYAKARAMVSFEPHSPIIAFAQGTPAIHLKQPSDTRKGQMWRDIGLHDWYFLIDETPASQISDTLLQIHNDYPAALATLEKARRYVTTVQKANIKVIKNAM